MSRLWRTHDTHWKVEQYSAEAESAIAKIFVRDKIIIYKLIFRWDTAGQEAYEEARRVCYDGTHVLLIGFSVVEPDSLANVENLWAKEAKLEKLRDAPVGQRVSSIIFYFFLFFFSLNLKDKIKYNYLVEYFLHCKNLIKK